MESKKKNNMLIDTEKRLMVAEIGGRECREKWKNGFVFVFVYSLNQLNEVKGKK